MLCKSEFNILIYRWYLFCKRKTFMVIKVEMITPPPDRRFLYDITRIFHILVMAKLCVYEINIIYLLKNINICLQHTPYTPISSSSLTQISILWFIGNNKLQILLIYNINLTFAARHTAHITR